VRAHLQPATHTAVAVHAAHSDPSSLAIARADCGCEPCLPHLQRTAWRQPSFSAGCADPPCTADLLYEELWRLLGSSLFAGAITCYALKARGW
jgi:hypothetical protein